MTTKKKPLKKDLTAPSRVPKPLTVVDSGDAEVINPEVVDANDENSLTLSDEALNQDSNEDLTPGEAEAIDGAALANVTPDDASEAMETSDAEVHGGAESTGAFLPEVAKRKELVRHDALSSYLSEVGRYPFLSREEEHETALQYIKSKDVQAAYRLVTSNLWLVVKIAREYEKAARNLLDLVQEGNLGLMEAVKNFDPYRGVRFPSYAVWWIRAYIIRFVIANWRLVKVGTTQSQRRLFFNLKKEKDRLEREGFFPAPKLIAEKLNVKESEVIEMEQRLGSADLSVDAPMQDDSDSNLLSVLPTGGESPEESLARRELAQRFQNALTEFATTLNPKEQLILKTRMLAEDKATLQDIAEQLKLSRERIRQLENRIQEKLKVFLEEKLGASLEDFVRQEE